MIDESRDVTHFNPAHTLPKRHALDAVAKLAARLGDITKLEDAVAEKLEEEAAFAAHIKATFRAGRPWPNSDGSVRIISLDEYCEQYGFNARTVRRWYKLLDEEVRKQEIQARAARVLKLVYGEQMAHVAQNAGENEWYTPQEYIEAARTTMGSIDLDPASTATANTIVKAACFFDADKDGLSQQWNGNVWMNPPYAQPLIGQFSARLAEEVGTGRVAQAVCLVNNATETEWFETLVRCSSAICFPRGRVKFWHPERVSAPLQGQACLYIGNNVEMFVTHFAQFGHTWIRSTTA